MLLHLSDQSSESLQGQIVQQVRAKVLAGDLTVDADLPSIRALARDHRVSVITVQRAYETLERQGLIYSRRGKGFFVADTSEESRARFATQELQQRLERPVTQALAEGLTPNDVQNAVAEILRRAEGSRS